MAINTPRSNMTERQLLAAVRDSAKFFGWMCYHTHDSRRSEPGFPDLVLVRGRRMLFRELKRDGGKVTDEQDKWLRALRDAGQSAYVWYADDWVRGRIVEELR